MTVPAWMVFPHRGEAVLAVVGRAPPLVFSVAEARKLAEALTDAADQAEQQLKAQPTPVAKE